MDIDIKAFRKHIAKTRKVVAKVNGIELSKVHWTVTCTYKQLENHTMTINCHRSPQVQTDQLWLSMIDFIGYELGTRVFLRWETSGWKGQDKVLRISWEKKFNGVTPLNPASYVK